MPEEKVPAFLQSHRCNTKNLRITISVFLSIHNQLLYFSKVSASASGWSNDACATPQRRPRHELAWIWTDFSSEQRRATGLLETAGRVARAGCKRQPAQCSCKTQDKFAIAFMAKKLLHRCIGAHARVHVYFLRRVCMHFDRCCEHHACAGVYVKQMLWTLAYTFAYTFATGCAYALMYVQFVHLALGNEDGGVQLVYESTRCLAWGIIFDWRKDRGVVCVFLIFNAGRSVCWCMYVYMHTHIHCTGGVIGCEPRSRDENRGGPEESRWTKSWHTYIRICVRSTHAYVYARRRDEILG